MTCAILAEDLLSVRVGNAGAVGVFKTHMNPFVRVGLSQSAHLVVEAENVPRRSAGVGSAFSKLVRAETNASPRVVYVRHADSRLSARVGNAGAADVFKIPTNPFVAVGSRRSVLVVVEAENVLLRSVGNEGVYLRGPQAVVSASESRKKCFEMNAYILLTI